MTDCRAVVRVRIPDRSGALGLVASRLGALKGDIVGIEVLDRIDGFAIDEFAVVFGSADILAAVPREIGEVDGATVEAIEVVDDFPEPRLDALRSALSFATAPDRTQLALRLVDAVARTVQATWCAVAGDGFAVRSAGAPPAEDFDGRSTHRIELAAADAVLHVHRDRDLSPGEFATAVAYCALVEVLWSRTPAEGATATPR